MTRITAEKMAKNSWRVPLITLFMMALSNSMIHVAWGTILTSVIYLIFFIIGLTYGIISCVAVRNHGRSTILVPAIIGILLNLSIPGTIIAIAVPSYLGARGNAVGSRLNQIAKEMSASSPIMVDKETRLDSVKVSDAGSLDFNYTIVSAIRDQVDVPAFSEAMTAALHDRYMKQPQMEWFRTHGIRINHIYNDKSGTRIATIVITKNLQQ